MHHWKNTVHWFSKGSLDLMFNYTCTDPKLQFQICPHSECIFMIKISGASVIARHNDGGLGINKCWSQCHL